MTRARHSPDLPPDPSDTSAPAAVEAPDAAAQPRRQGRPEQGKPPQAGRPDQEQPRPLAIRWERLRAIGANTDLREMLEHVLNPGWEGVGPGEVGDVIAQAATQAAVLDYLDWFFSEEAPPDPEALPAVYQALVTGAAAAARESASALVPLGPDVLALLDDVLTEMPQDHPVATAVVHVHLLLATWRARDLAKESNVAADDVTPSATPRESGTTESLANRLYASARDLLRDKATEDALEMLLAGTLAALQGAPVWFGWSHEFAGTPLERPLQEGLSLVALLRRVPSCPFPLRTRFADERCRWRDVVLTGRYVDFESLVQPHPDRLMRGPAVTSFLRGLASEGRDFNPDDLAQGLRQLEVPAREQVWLYLYFNAGYIAPNLLGQSATSLQLVLLDSLGSGECWSREVAEALLDDLTYHPPMPGSVQLEEDERSAAEPAGDSPDSAPPTGPEIGEARVSLAVRSQAAALLARRLLDDPSVADLLADTRRYAGHTSVGRWLRAIAPGHPAPHFN